MRLITIAAMKCFAHGLMFTHRWYSYARVRSYCECSISAGAD